MYHGRNQCDHFSRRPQIFLTGVLEKVISYCDCLHGSYLLREKVDPKNWWMKRNSYYALARPP
ncbi:MAG: hypothetical protein ACTSWR_07235 [Candidatus Helarchaeota archaeon]